MTNLGIRYGKLIQGTWRLDTSCTLLT